MHALFIEVDANDSHVEKAREFLNRVAVPGAREHGAKAGYWLAPAGSDRGVSITVYDSEAKAREAAQMFEVGSPPMPDAPAGVVVRTVEVREVIAAL